MVGTQLVDGLPVAPPAKQRLAAAQVGRGADQGCLGIRQIGLGLLDFGGLAAGLQIGQLVLGLRQ